MSASICYQPVDPKPKTIGAWAPSHFMESMERANLGLPCTLKETDIPILRGMAATFSDHGDAPNPYQEIIDAIEKYGAIEMWAEH